jgi:hypothetical protein
MGKLMRKPHVKTGGKSQTHLPKGKVWDIYGLKLGKSDWALGSNQWSERA